MFWCFPVRMCTVERRGALFMHGQRPRAATNHAAERRGGTAALGRLPCCLNLIQLCGSVLPGKLGLIGYLEI